MLDLARLLYAAMAILLAYALRERMAGWHGPLPPNPTSAVPLGTVAALTIAPFLAAVL